MPYGVPGDIARGFSGQQTVESQAFNPLLPFLAFGLPGKMAGGLFVPLALVGDVGAYGWLVRPFPTVGLNASDPLGAGVPLCTAGRQADVLVRGYLNVFCQAGVAAAQGTVYLRYANPAGAAIVGGVEAALIAGTTIALTGVSFMGPSDPNGNAEIRINI
jgi:hypothetical protein